MSALVIGIGNDSSGDDAAGLLVVRELRQMGDAGTTLLEHSGDGTSLVESWKGFTHVFIIDAVRSSAEPGSVHRWTDLESQPAVHRASTHALGLAEAWRLAKVLQVLPESLIVYGIEGSNYGIGQPVSDEVMSGVDNVVERIAQELRNLRSGGETQDA